MRKLKPVFLSVFLLFIFTGCSKTNSLSVEFTGRWRGTEMLNPPGMHTGVFVPVPAGENYFAEFGYGGEFKGHYYFLDGWEQYQIWPEIKIATLYKNEKNDSLRIGYQINATSTELILDFPSYEESKLKLVR
jgi:hypothetical protein